MQTSEEIPIRIFFLIFLLWFVLIGLTPFFQKIWAKILLYSRALRESAEGGSTLPGSGAAKARAGMTAIPELYDFEVMVLGKLAGAGRKGLSIRQIARELYVDLPVVETALKSLAAKGLVRFVPTLAAGKRVYLSGKGRDYAIRQGFLP